MKKQKVNFFLGLVVVSGLAINVSFILEKWEYSYILFWVAVCLLLVGMVGSVLSGSFKKMCELLEKIL